MKQIKRAISALLCAVLLFSLGACGTKPNENKELQKITLSLDWTPNTNHTGIYVSLAKGYFKDAGLDVTVVQPSPNGAAAMCAAGQAQFAIEFQDTLAAAFAMDKPLGVTAIAAILQHNTSGILSRKGEGLDRPRGLENHIYATWDSPIEKAMIKSVVETNGGDFSKVKLIPNNFTDEAGALNAKIADAIWVFYAWGGIASTLADGEFDYFDFKDINPVFDYYTPVLIGNNDYIKENPETTKALLSALKKGYEFAIDNPEEAAQILIDGDDTGSLKGSETLVTESQKWISKQYKAEVSQWGYIDPARWDAFYAWLWEQGLIEKELPAGTGYTNDYLS